MKSIDMNSRPLSVDFFSRDDCMKLAKMSLGIFYFVRAYTVLSEEAPQFFENEPALITKLNTLSVLFNSVLGIVGLYWAFNGILTLYKARFFKSHKVFADSFLASFRGMGISHFMSALVGICILVVPLIDIVSIIQSVKKNPYDPRVYNRVIMEFFAFLFAAFMFGFMVMWFSMKPMR